MASVGPCWKKMCPRFWVLQTSSTVSSNTDLPAGEQHVYNAVLGNPFFKFPGGACPRNPLETRASGARLVRILVGPHPPAKKPALRTCEEMFENPTRSLIG